MIVSVGIVDFHVFKKPFDVLVEEAFNFSVVELRINKEGADVRLHDIRESLKTKISNQRRANKASLDTFGAVFVKVQ